MSTENGALREGVLPHFLVILSLGGMLLTRPSFFWFLDRFNENDKCGSQLLVQWLKILLSTVSTDEKEANQEWFVSFLVCQFDWFACGALTGEGSQKKVLMPLFLPRHACAGWLSVENDVIFQVLICTIVLST